MKEHVEERHSVRLVSHSDADGVAAGGLLVKALTRLGGGFKSSCFKRVDEKMIGKIASEKPRLVVFSDLGSGYVDLFKKHLDSDVIILDHHLPVEIEAENIVSFQLFLPPF